MRLLELDVLREIFKHTYEGQLTVSTIVFVDVDQFYGIEIEEFPAQIAQVALWMTDHQMNQVVSSEFGQYFARLPLKKAPNIVQGNALQLNWKAIVNPKDLTYIVGNPPFVGHYLRNAQQAEDMSRVWPNKGRFGRLDYVACWYKKSLEMMSVNKSIRAALVSTSSITQGEQAGILWPYLIREGLEINFAHRTFQWSSEASGKAAVHCVIVGFALESETRKVIFEYENPQSDAHAIIATQINGYLVNAANVYIGSRTSPRPGFPTMTKGSQATDGGHLFLDSGERTTLLREEPEARKYLRRFLGADEFLWDIERWCLWLVDADPKSLRDMPLVLARIKAVRLARLKSKTPSVRALAGQATLFTQIRQPTKNYLLIPRHSSENRAYIPMGFMTPDVICGDANLMLPGATKYHLGVLSSRMHMAWVGSVCGRLESRYRYSPAVYDSFPWPEPTDRQRATVEAAAQTVLDERAKHPGATLADLYDPLSMPPALVKAHHALDRAVDTAYGKTNFASEAERVAFLFTLYEKLTSLFPTEKKQRRKRSN
jgi:hypothetical protein